MTKIWVVALCLCLPVLSACGANSTAVKAAEEVGLLSSSSGNNATPLFTEKHEYKRSNPGNFRAIPKRKEGLISRFLPKPKPKPKLPLSTKIYPSENMRLYQQHRQNLEAN